MRKNHVDISPAKLTVEKLIMARRMLNQGTFNSDQKMYFVCTAQQLTDLLQDDKVVSGDYNSVKALVSGELKTFMGFEFIISELLTGITGVTTLDDNGAIKTAPTHSIRECFAFTEDAIKFATVKGSSITKTDELPMKHYAPMLYHSQSFGAARASEGKIVIVKCLEPWRADHRSFNQWLEVKGDPAVYIAASIVPATSIADWSKVADNLTDMWGQKPDTLKDFLISKQPMLAKKKNSSEEAEQCEGRGRVRKAKLTKSLNKSEEFDDDKTELK